MVLLSLRIARNDCCLFFFLLASDVETEALENEIVIALNVHFLSFFLTSFMKCLFFLAGSSSYVKFCFIFKQSLSRLMFKIILQLNQIGV